MPPLQMQMLPEEFNDLRKELHENWPDIFQRVGWYMMWDWPMFIETMNMILQERIPFNATVEVASTQYIIILRKKRGAA